VILPQLPMTGALVKRRRGRYMRPMKPLAATLVALTALSGCRERPPGQAEPSTPAGTGDSTVPAGTLATSAGAGAVSSPTAAVGTASPFVAEKVTGEGRAMGTHLAYAGYTTPTLDAAHVHALFDAATTEIVRLEKLMTTWDPASEVSRVNAAAGREPVHVSPETFDVIREALHASAISDGTFDITFETLHGLWKFDQDLDPHPPTPSAVRAQARYVGYKHVKIDPSASTVFLDEPHVRIGLGGIAKGYAVDHASKVLLDGGLVSFYAQAGGDLYAQGTKPDGSPWIAGIRDPRGPENDYFATMAVSDHAFSTAGDYERSYMVDGKRYHHIIDPRTGYPATASRSVTIWATNAFIADEIDDAVFILGPKRGLALVESLDGVGAVIVDAQNRVWTSQRLEGHVHPVHPPTDAP
jgi:FAD:protein FMN transferase